MTEFPDEAWGDLRTVGRLCAVAAGDSVFREGDAADGAYILLAGRCAVLEGDDHVNVLTPGEFFGEIGALGDGVRSATVMALDDTRLLFVSVEQLRDGLAASPELVWRALRLIVGRLQQISAREVAYRDEHKALREVQRSLLPNLAEIDTMGAFEVDAVWEPCTYASGDYFDVIALDAKRHLVAVGDVMGHGAESSLMMAIARAQIRELARSFRRTDELLLHLDGYLRDNAPPRQGMSLVLTMFDRRERLLEYSVAGHPPPLLYRDGTMTDLPGRSGILLALPFLLGTGYERREIELRPDDQLLLFTDGLIEVPIDADGTLLGRQGLAGVFGEVTALRADAPLAALIERVRGLDVNQAADDDRTAVLLTIR